MLHYSARFSTLRSSVRDRSPAYPDEYIQIDDFDATLLNLVYRSIPDTSETPSGELFLKKRTCVYEDGKFIPDVSVCHGVDTMSLCKLVLQLPPTIWALNAHLRSFYYRRTKWITRTDDIYKIVLDTLHVGARDGIRQLYGSMSLYFRCNEVPAILFFDLREV